MRTIESSVCRVLAFIAAFVLHIGLAQADHLTPDEALARLSASGMHRVAGVDPVSAFRLAHTQMAPHGDLEAVYVFGRTAGEGFMVVAADDEVGDILLGYSDCTRFDSDDIPCGMKWLLGAYAEYVDYAKAHTAVRSQAPARAAHAAIAPLVTTQWNQGSPYNDLCPIVDGSRCVTGCVATAMAQVMKYHAWPTRGQGSHSYTFTVNGNAYSASANFGSTTYQWSRMLDRYSTSSSQTSKTAVATLMAHCGVATEMGYSPSSSGTPTAFAGMGMLEYFDYDASMQYLSRCWYTAEEWDEIVYDQLERSLPVLYSGFTSNNEGHAFVCDGCDATGKYHINWGWGGACDGYFMLANLDPYDQGIGGSDGNLAFNYQQQILADIRPASAEPSTPCIIMGLWDEFATDQETYDRKTGSVIFSGDFGAFSLVEYEYSIGFRLVYPTSSEYMFFTPNALKPGYYIPAFRVKAGYFPEGEYDIYPVYLDGDGNVQTMPHDLSTGDGALHVYATSTTITFTKGAHGYKGEPEPDPDPDPDPNPDPNPDPDPDEPSDEMVLSVKTGWNWVSNGFAEALPLDSLYGYVDRIVGQLDETVYDTGLGCYVGGIDCLMPGMGYKVQATEDFDVTYSQYGVNSGVVPVALHRGWNWIAYPSCDGRLLSSVIANADDGDALFSQDSFSQFTGGEWNGTLTDLHPGWGYIYYSATDKEALLFDLSAPVVIASELTPGPSADVCSHKYPDTMNMVVSLCAADSTALDTDCTLQATCDGELRGMGTVVDGLHYITIHGTAQELMQLTATSADGCVLAAAAVPFADGCVGDRQQPYIIVMGDADGLDSTAGRRSGCDVYRIDGTRVQGNALRRLPRGIYIIGGRRHTIVSTK